MIRHIFKYLRNADGSEAANVNGLATPVEFKFQPDRACVIHRMLITIQDTGFLAALNYGSLPTLTHGLEVELVDADGVLDLLDGVPVRSNVGWAASCYDSQENTYSGGGGSKAITVRWTFDKSGRPLRLESGDQVRVRVRDNLSGLDAHLFQVQGYYT